MIRPTENLTPVKIRNVVPGQQTTLDAGTPNGLFEADNGNLYLVTHEDDDNIDHKFAIVLRHYNLQRFTSLMLTAQSLEWGTLHGAYQLRLTHSLHGEAPYFEAGDICVDREDFLFLSCWGKKHHPRRITIGHIGRKLGTQICDASKCAWCDFDGWKLFPAENTHSVSKRAPTGQRSWLLDMQPLKTLSEWSDSDLADLGFKKEARLEIRGRRGA